MVAPGGEVLERVELDEGGVLAVLGDEVLVGQEPGHRGGELVHALAVGHEPFLGPGAHAGTKDDDDHADLPRWATTLPCQRGGGESTGARRRCRRGGGVYPTRSEERRVGKECRSRWCP